MSGRFVVQFAGTPIGTVDLTATELSAGRLVPLPAYEQIASRIRAASEALLSFGLYGPRVSVLLNTERRRARAALGAAATLRIQIVPVGSETVVETMFVNLVEAPWDGHIVVIARFADETADVFAALPLNKTGGGGTNEPNVDLV